MAKRHVIQYYLELENEYIEMQDTLKELQTLAQEGKVEESSYLSMLEDVNLIKNNYERVSYIMFLLNKPNRREKESKELEVNKQWYSYLKGASKEAILDETKDALAEFKKKVKEISND